MSSDFGRQLDLYLDDCAFSHKLVSTLERAGHTTHVPASVGLQGARDHVHFKCAADNGWVVLTKNPHDFKNLHEAWRRRNQSHSGVFVICADNVRGKDMEADEIVRSIARLCDSGLPIANELYILNHWRFG